MSIKETGIDGAIKINNKLKQDGFYVKPLYQYGQQVKRAVAPYVAPPAGSTYRRTGRLGRSWFVTPSKDAVVISNAAPYSGYVQAKDTQVLVHKRSGWKVVETVAIQDEQMRVFIKVLKAEIAKLVIKNT